PLPFFKTGLSTGSGRFDARHDVAKSVEGRAGDEGVNYRGPPESGLRQKKFLDQSVILCNFWSTLITNIPMERKKMTQQNLITLNLPRSFLM
ncbi:MAG TPA: hypothetical protein PKZ64_18490, partial [Spirochaetota bacterium]|nr:hypothetical protein [Spirochaetota bacterium]